MSKSEEFMATLRAFHQDPALGGGFFAGHPEAIDLMRDLIKRHTRKPLPKIVNQDAASVEVSIFDNWPRGRAVKYKPRQFGFVVQADEREMPDLAEMQHRFTGDLRTGKEAIDTCKSLEAGSPTGDKLVYPMHPDDVVFVAAVIDCITGDDPDPDAWRFGLCVMGKKGQPTAYVSAHLLAVRTEVRDGIRVFERGQLWTGPKEPIHLNGFDRTYSNGKRLTKNCVVQSRTTPTGSRLAENWATGREPSPLKLVLGPIVEGDTVEDQKIAA